MDREGLGTRLGGVSPNVQGRPGNEARGKSPPMDRGGLGTRLGGVSP